MTDLGEYLRAAAARRREPGIWDCAAFPADWAMANGHPDPMAAWRGAYASESGAIDLIDAAGSLCALFERGMTSAGLERVGEPEPGDIGVLQVLGEQAGAVYTGKRWALVADRGLAFASIEPEHVLQIWRVANG